MGGASIQDDLQAAAQPSPFSCCGGGGNNSTRWWSEPQGEETACQPQRPSTAGGGGPLRLRIPSTQQPQPPQQQPNRHLQLRRLVYAPPPSAAGGGAPPELRGGGLAGGARLLRSTYQGGSHGLGGGYLVLGRIGDEDHCKPQTSVVVARPLPAFGGEYGEAAAGGCQERAWPEPGTPPFHPWRQRQQPWGQGGRAEGAGGDDKVAIKVGVWVLKEGAAGNKCVCGVSGRRSLAVDPAASAVAPIHPFFSSFPSSTHNHRINQHSPPHWHIPHRSSTARGPAATTRCRRGTGAGRWGRRRPWRGCPRTRTSCRCSRRWRTRRAPTWSSPWRRRSSSRYLPTYRRAV